MNLPPAASHSLGAMDPLKPNLRSPQDSRQWPRGRAEIHVLMPLRDAQRNAPIQIVFGESSRSRIHHADEAIAVAVFLIEQDVGCSG